jgi:hypothetical protein
VTCDYGSLTNAFNDPVKQWTDSNSTAAYAEALTAYQKDKTAQATVPWPDYLGNFFHSRVALACDLLGDGNCEVSGVRL